MGESMTAQTVVHGSQFRQATARFLSMPTEQLAEQAETQRFAAGLALAAGLSLPVWALAAFAIFG